MVEDRWGAKEEEDLHASLPNLAGILSDPLTIQEPIDTMVSCCDLEANKPIVGNIGTFE